ncbi:MAG TPA: hypothetical protein VHR36_14715 [Pyrinomonadaceae bacterium]|jgi:hypothetical protein|nr:hypothetical protein [Pyrinomonadaceae bacterium]
MESEISTAETGLELPLAEPHFDDEATVLSARPVVPLDEVEPFVQRTPSRLTRGWAFAATVIGAMLLGVVVAVAYYSYTNDKQSQPSVRDETIAAGVDGLASEPAAKGDAVVSASEVPATSQTEGAIAKPAPALSQPVISTRDGRKPVARRVDVITLPSSPEERKAARRLAKQQRREMEREGRDRNLTRIREIFEGPQRP